jgi:glucose-6-phosphate isomerase
VGALIALYERAVSIYAYLVNINAYHQPGVEAGKKAAASILSLQTEILTLLGKTSDSLTIAQIASELGKNDDIESIYKILRHLSANDRGIVLKGDRISPNTLEVIYSK